MRRNDAFSSVHPSATFLFYSLVIVFSTLTMHPALLVVSFVSSLLYYITSGTGKKSAGLLKGILPIVLMTAVINPLFNHNGATVLCRFPWGSPLTAESIFYGISAGVMLSAVLLWFGSFTVVMTTDKFIYLFGRVVPSLALLLSMTLRFIPKFREQFEKVSQAQKAFEPDLENEGKLQKLKRDAECFSAVVTWSMENSVLTADSMKSRGYGTAKRTAFSVYRFGRRDKALLIYYSLDGALIAFLMASGKLLWKFFPEIKYSAEPLTFIGIAAFAVLCLTPLVINRMEERLWKRSLSAL